MKHTREHTSIVLVRGSSAVDGPWTILSAGRGKSRQLFTAEEAAKAVQTLPDDLVGCALNVHALVAIAASVRSIEFDGVPSRMDAVAAPLPLYASE